MKILEVKDHSFKKTCVCNSCSTKFEIELSDIKVKEEQVNGQNWDVFYVLCPVCSWSREIACDFDDDYYGEDGALTFYQKRLIKQSQ